MHAERMWKKFPMLRDFELAKERETPTESIGESGSLGSRLIVVTAGLSFRLYNDENGEINVEDNCWSSKELSALASCPLFEESLVVAPVYLFDKNSGQQILEPFSDEVKLAIQEKLAAIRSHAVFSVTIPNSFSEKILYPCFHYSAALPVDASSECYWSDYENMNKAFADTVLSVYRPGDVVSVHDYPLFLVPRCLRQSHPEIIIAFYLHTVFPSSEVYRILPQREELLRGVLGTNVLAMHNFVYVRHFLTACTRILGVACSASAVLACEESGGSTTRVVAVPLGIDTSSLLKDPKSLSLRISQLKASFNGRKIILSVDSLDEKRGITHKLLAFQKLLIDRPELREQCVLVQLCEKDENSKCLLQRIYQILGDINSGGSVDLLPVHFIIKEKLLNEDIVPLYCLADVFLDTALRDVMSKHSFEFLYCTGEVVDSQPDEVPKFGALVVSEFTGSAVSLRAASLSVNPWDIGSFSEIIAEALNMDEYEKMERIKHGKCLVAKCTSSHWAQRYLQEIKESMEAAETETLLVRPWLNQSVLIDLAREQNRGRLLVVVGLVGVLSRLVQKGNSGCFSEASMSLANSLSTLACDQETDVIVFTQSGKECPTLLFPGNIGILAESGAVARDFEGNWNTLVDFDVSWMSAVEKIMRVFADRNPGSFVERNNYSLIWSYPKNQQDFGSIQAKDLMIHLWAGPLLAAPAEVLNGPNFVLVRPAHLNCAEKLEKLLKTKSADNSYNMAVCVGDFLSKDEDIYSFVSRAVSGETSAISTPRGSIDSTNNRVFNCTLGKKASRASFAVKDSNDAIFLIAKMAWATSRRAEAFSSGLTPKIASAPSEGPLLTLLQTFSGSK